MNMVPRRGSNKVGPGLRLICEWAGGGGDFLGPVGLS